MFLMSPLLQTIDLKKKCFGQEIAFNYVNESGAATCGGAEIRASGGSSPNELS
jgi:hypothetical protein